jgi:hypothetical protein
MIILIASRAKSFCLLYVFVHCYLLQFLVVLRSVHAPTENYDEAQATGAIYNTQNGVATISCSTKRTTSSVLANRGHRLQ